VDNRIVYLPVEVTEYADLYDKGWYFKGRLKMWDHETVYSIRWDNVRPTAMTMIDELESTIEGRKQMRLARQDGQRARENEVRAEALRWAAEKFRIWDKDTPTTTDVVAEWLELWAESEEK
jgi:hypothetical protein